VANDGGVIGYPLLCDIPFPTRPRPPKKNHEPPAPITPLSALGTQVPENPVIRSTRAMLGDWTHRGLLDEDTATALREDLEDLTRKGSERMARYLLAIAAGVVLVIAAVLFLRWTWPMLGPATRTIVLEVIGVLLVICGVKAELRGKWVPASHLIQLTGLGVLTAAVGHLMAAWPDDVWPRVGLGLVALVVPVGLIPGALRRSALTPAAHLLFALIILAMLLLEGVGLDDRATVSWMIGVYLATLSWLWLRVARQTARRPSGLPALVTLLVAGFWMAGLTADILLGLDNRVVLVIDGWWLILAALCVWARHRCPANLQAFWLSYLMPPMVVAWIGLGFATVADVFTSPPELQLLLIGGMGIVAFLYARHHHQRLLLLVSTICFLLSIHTWAMEREGPLASVAALTVTGLVLFRLSMRRGRISTG